MQNKIEAENKKVDLIIKDTKSLYETAKDNPASLSNFLTSGVGVETFNIDGKDVSFVFNGIQIKAIKDLETRLTKTQNTTTAINLNGLTGCGKSTILSIITGDKSFTIKGSNGNNYNGKQLQKAIFKDKQVNIFKFDYNLLYNSYDGSLKKDAKTIINDFLLQANKASSNIAVIAIDEIHKIPLELKKYIEKVAQEINNGNKNGNKKLINLFASATPHYIDLLKDEAKGGNHCNDINRATDGILTALDRCNAVNDAKNIKYHFIVNKNITNYQNALTDSVCAYNLSNFLTYKSPSSTVERYKELGIDDSSGIIIFERKIPNDTEPKSFKTDYVIFDNGILKSKNKDNQSTNSFNRDDLKEIYIKSKGKITLFADSEGADFNISDQKPYNSKLTIIIKPEHLLAEGADNAKSNLETQSEFIQCNRTRLDPASIKNIEIKKLIKDTDKITYSQASIDEINTLKQKLTSAKLITNTTNNQGNINKISIEKIINEIEEDYLPNQNNTIKNNENLYLLTLIIDDIRKFDNKNNKDSLLEEIKKIIDLKDESPENKQQFEEILIDALLISNLRHNHQSNQSLLVKKNQYDCLKYSSEFKTKQDVENFKIPNVSYKKVNDLQKLELSLKDNQFKISDFNYQLTNVTYNILNNQKIESINKSQFQEYSKLQNQDQFFDNRVRESGFKPNLFQQFHYPEQQNNSTNQNPSLLTYNQSQLSNSGKSDNHLRCEEKLPSGGGYQENTPNSSFQYNQYSLSSPRGQNNQGSTFISQTEEKYLQKNSQQSYQQKNNYDHHFIAKNLSSFVQNGTLNKKYEEYAKKLEQKKDQENLEKDIITLNKVIEKCNKETIKNRKYTDNILNLLNKSSNYSNQSSNCHRQDDLSDEIKKFTLSSSQEENIWLKNENSILRQKMEELEKARDPIGLEPKKQEEMAKILWGAYNEDEGKAIEEIKTKCQAIEYSLKSIFTTQKVDQIFEKNLNEKIIANQNIHDGSLKFDTWVKVGRGALDKIMEPNEKEKMRELLLNLNNNLEELKKLREFKTNFKTQFDKVEKYGYGADITNQESIKQFIAKLQDPFLSPEEGFKNGQTLQNLFDDVARSGCSSYRIIQSLVDMTKFIKEKNDIDPNQSISKYSDTNYSRCGEEINKLSFWIVAKAVEKIDSYNQTYNNLNKENVSIQEELHDLSMNISTRYRSQLNTICMPLQCKPLNMLQKQK